MWRPHFGSTEPLCGGAVGRGRYRAAGWVRPGMSDEPGLRDLVAAVVRISDSLDRLTFMVEEIASRGLEIPTRDEELVD
jgi:hypothetical protein